MQLRAVQQFVVHVESFRNVDIWYQGAYMLALQIYQGSPKAVEKSPNTPITFAHPFALTQHYFPGDPQNMVYDSQIVKTASIDHKSSTFLSKAFLLRYYQEEVQLNDICHFRVETDISPLDTQFCLQIDLLFYDQQAKKVDPETISLSKGKKVKSQKFILKRSKQGIHSYAQTIFDGQYYSLTNIMVHSVCLDYRLRMRSLQLFEFSRLSSSEKKELLDRNRKIQQKEVSYLTSIARQLKITDESLVLQTIQQLVVRDMKAHHQGLLREYGLLYGKVLTQSLKNQFSQLLVHPSQLSLFEEEERQAKGHARRSRTTSKDEMVQSMLNQSNLIGGQLIKLWHHFIDLLKISPRFATAHYESLNSHKLSLFWSNYYRQQLEPTVDICLTSNDNHRNNQRLEEEMMAGRAKVLVDWEVVGEDMLSKQKIYPVMVENHYGKKKALEIEQFMMGKGQGVSLHLVVLVHGFQGNSLDMKVIKNSISALYPETAFLCASSNQELTDTDVIQMGNRLATEVKNHIIEFFPPQTLQRISFVGHSLGGVIIRAALPRLLDLKDKFHTLMTFSSPHIGYKVNASSVIEAGIWVLQKFKNSNCLTQLTMTDHPNPRETCLYKVSKFQGPRYFKNIFLFSSKQDSYAPYQSSRVEIHPDFMNAKDPLKEVHCEMVRNILEGVKEEALHRVRVNFTIGGTSIDSIIGRTAHILFLESSQLMQVFLHTHPELFE